MTVNLVASALLAGALALFLLSARQLPFWGRSILLCLGGVLVCAAIIVISNIEGHFGLFKVAVDAWTHMGDLGNSVIAIALQRNEGSVERHILPLLDLFAVVTTLVGVFAIIALTPGEGVERFVRPFITLLLGVMLGASLALSIVAIGFGGPVDQRVYAGMGQRQNVYDGDTFWLGETSFRLFGVDAPERDQPCIHDANCGRSAADKLAGLIDGGLVRCVVRERSGAVTESFGRPLVVCTVRDPGGSEFDLGERLVRDGYAVVYSGMQGEQENLDNAERGARTLRAGLLNDCWLNPKAWRSRSGRSARDAFLARRFQDIPAENLIGACPVVASNFDNLR